MLCAKLGRQWRRISACSVEDLHSCLHSTRMHSPAPAAFCALKQGAEPSRRRRHSLKSMIPFLLSPGCPCPRGRSMGKRCSPGALLPERNALTFLIGVHLSLSGVFTTQGVRRSLLPGTGSGASCPSPSDTDVHEEAGRKSSAKAKHRDSLGEMALPSYFTRKDWKEQGCKRPG